MRVVKALVAFMAVLIVVGVALVGYGLSRQGTETAMVPENAPSVPLAGVETNPASATAMASSNSVPLLAPFGTINIELVPGETLVDFSRNGVEATLRIEGRFGSRLVIVSLTDGSILGQIVLHDPEQ